MARIAHPARPSWWIRLLFAASRWRYGRTPEPLVLAAHVPRFIVPFLFTNRFAHGRGALPEALRLLAMQLVGELNRCDWCVDFGRSLAHGTTAEKIGRVCDFETDPVFSDDERAALRYAHEAAQTPARVTDETFAALRRHFSEPQIVELAYAVAIESFFNRINAPLGIEAEGYCALPV